MIVLGTGDVAKYPFLHEAQQYVQGFSWEVFASDHTVPILQRAIQRLRAAAAGEYDTELADYTIEILTFLAALTIVKKVGLEQLTRKFALAEARRVEYFLERDIVQDGERNSALTNSLILQVLEREFNLKVQRMTLDSRWRKGNCGCIRCIEAGGKFTQPKQDETTYDVFAVPVPEFLKHATRFRAPEWSLVNRNVHRGMVYLSGDDTVRLVRHELAVLITDRVKAMQVPADADLPENLRMRIEYAKQELAPKVAGRYAGMPGTFPPCVRQAMEMLQKGENVPHSGRVLLATYMAAVGKNGEDIIEMFKSAPDYNERITRTQVEFLCGMRGSGRAYMPKGCDKLRAENWCFADGGCVNIKHPLQYGRARKA